MMIESLLEPDWPEVRRIYEEGMATGFSTFETETPPWDLWDHSHMEHPRIVARLAARESVAGWAALSPVSDRCVYGGVAEVSIYVGADYRGRGVGTALLGRLVEASEEAGVWTLQGGVFPENRSSRGLFERHGFREVGVRERLGRLDGIWRDVLLLERRSLTVGTGFNS